MAALAWTYSTGNDNSTMGYGRTRIMENIPGVPNLGKEEVNQKMQYEEACRNMEPLCDHCRSKLTNQILDGCTQGGNKRVFQFGDRLYQVECLR